MDDLLHAQLDHNTWATRQIILASRELDADAFTRSCDIGPGSLQQTLAHIVDAMSWFAAVLREQTHEPMPDFDERSQTPDGLLALLGVADRDLHDAVATYLEEHFTRDQIAWPATGSAYPAAVVLAQIFDHGTHHRAQCLNMLKQAGVTELPKTWPLAWVDLLTA